METWKAVGAGLLTFLVAVFVALATYPTTILLVGLPSGFVAGHASDGFLSGVLSSVLTGVGAAVLFFATGYYLATSPDRVAPGVGIAIFLIAVTAAGLAVESTLAGAVGSLTNR